MLSHLGDLPQHFIGAREGVLDSPDASFLGQKAWEKDKRCRAPVGETFAPKQIIWSQVAKLDELGKFCCAQRPMLLAVA